LARRKAEDKIRTHVLPTLGKVRLDKLISGQVERLYGPKLAAGLCRPWSRSCM
jgi:hypothetical protein